MHTLSTDVERLLQPINADVVLGTHRRTDGIAIDDAPFCLTAPIRPDETFGMDSKMLVRYPIILLAEVRQFVARRI
jgi:hypothetical protein